MNFSCLKFWASLINWIPSKVEKYIFQSWKVFRRHLIFGMSLFIHDDSLLWYELLQKGLILKQPLACCAYDAVDPGGIKKLCFDATEADKFWLSPARTTFSFELVCELLGLKHGQQQW